MDFITYIHAIILGLIEGLTEFIPVSSTGHLILLSDLLGFKGGQGHVFEIAIQLGAILAICFVYKERLIHCTRTLTTEKKSQHLVRNITLAFLPAAIIGVMAHSTIKTLLFSPLVVSIMLIVGGIIILLVERMNLAHEDKDISEFSPKLCLYIGLCQCLAMIPGTSRSGATILGAVLLGTSRRSATEFSFFLAIPTMLGATVYDIYKNLHHLNTDSIGVIVVGFITAFIAARFIVSHAIKFISTHGFTPFAWYRILLGSIMLALLFNR